MGRDAFDEGRVAGGIKSSGIFYSARHGSKKQESWRPRMKFLFTNGCVLPGTLNFSTTTPEFIIFPGNLGLDFSVLSFLTGILCCTVVVSR